MRRFAIPSLHRHGQLVLLAAATWAALYSRSVIGPLQETVRQSLRLSDNQTALLQGMAMAVPMALGAIPLGVLADRLSRARILLCFVMLALISVVLSALSPTFISLFAARSLAGLASAGIYVAAFSIVADLYAPEARGRASMIVASGEIFGAPVSFALGGALLVAVGSAPGVRILGSQFDDWRVALLGMSALLVPIVLLMLWLREPTRAQCGTPTPPWRAVLPELWRYRAVALPVLLARAMVWIADGAVFVWAAPYFSRRFAWSSDRIGALMGTVLLASGLLGPLLGGLVSDFCQHRAGPRYTVMTLCGIALLCVPAALFSLMPDPIVAAIVLVVFLTLGFSIGTAGVTLALIVIPSELRGAYLGLTMTIGSIFFVGLAPLLVSALAGALGGEAMIGPALTVVCAAASLFGAVVFAHSARYFPTHSRSSSKTGLLRAEELY